MFWRKEKKSLNKLHNLPIWQISGLRILRVCVCVRFFFVCDFLRLIIDDIFFFVVDDIIIIIIITAQRHNFTPVYSSIFFPGNLFRFFSLSVIANFEQEQNEKTKKKVKVRSSTHYNLCVFVVVVVDFYLFFHFHFVAAAVIFGPILSYPIMMFFFLFSLHHLKWKLIYIFVFFLLLLLCATITINNKKKKKKKP